MKNGSTFVCSRCHTEVSFHDVTDGYFAVCPKHDEDLWQFETIEIVEDAA